MLYVPGEGIFMSNITGNKRPISKSPEQNIHANINNLVPIFSTIDINSLEKDQFSLASLRKPMIPDEMEAASKQKRGYNRVCRDKKKSLGETMSPDEKEAASKKRREYNRLYQDQKKSLGEAMSPDEKEAAFEKRRECNRLNREKKNSLREAMSPDEKEAASEKRKQYNRVYEDKKRSLREAMSPDEKEALSKARGDRERGSREAMSCDERERDIIHSRGRQKKWREENANLHNKIKRDKYHNKIPDDMKEYLNNPDHACRMFYAIGQKYNIDVDNKETILLPITQFEKAECIKNFQRATNPNSTIYGCSSCGVWVRLLETDKPFQLPLGKLDCLEVSSDIVRSRHFRNMRPRFRKVKGMTKCRNGSYYYVYRHFIKHVDTEEIALDDDFPALAETCMAYFCEKCYKDIKEQMTPKFSLAMDIDFGVTRFLPKLSILAKLMLNKCHIYCHILKLSGNGVSQYALNGHCITMEVNAKYAVELLKANSKGKLPQQPGQDFGFKIMYIGKMDKWNKIINNDPFSPSNNLMKTFGKVLFVPWEDLSIWIDFLTYIHPDSWERDNSITSQADINSIIQKNIIDVSYTADEESDVGKIDIEIDEEAPPIAGGETGQEENDDTGITQYSFLTTREEQIHEDIMNDRINILNSIKHDFEPDIKIKHSKQPLNEYTQMASICNGMFPSLFPFGYPHSSNRPITDDEIKHMLNQASNYFADDTMFVSYMFNYKMRRRVSQSVKYAYLKNPEVTEELNKALLDENFVENLEYAIANPNTAFGKKWNNGRNH